MIEFLGLRMVKFVLYLISYVSLFFILNIFLERKKIEFSRTILFGMLTIIILMVTIFVDPTCKGTFALVFVSLCPFIFSVCFFSNTMSEKFIATIYLYAIISILESIAVIIMLFSFGSLEPEIILNVYVFSFRVLMIALYYYLKSRHVIRFDMKIKGLNFKQKFIFCVVLIIIALYGVFIIYYTAFDNQSSFYFNAKTIFSILITISFLFLTAYLLQKIKKESQLDYEHEKINAILTYQTKYYERIEHALIEARRLKHDMKNHTLTIGHLIQSGEANAALDYLETLGTVIDSIEVGFSTGHRIVDVIMYEKKKFCASKGIPFHFMGYVSEDLPYASTDLCIIIGNAIDNAIEACLKVNRELEPFIEVETYLKQGHWIFKVANTALPVDINRLTSTKPNKNQHGYGIRNIRESVQKYGGHVNFLYQEGCFKAQVIMPYFGSQGSKD